jgi:TM2 domain-containing membrane protein YozV
MGVDSLSGRPRETQRSRRRPRLAALCALFPGMGAVYNKQNIKAVVHFVVTMGLFQLSGLHVLEGLFVLGGMAFYIYSIVDAYRTAQLIAQGESAAVDEQRFKQSIRNRASTIGVGLIVVGILLVVQVAQPFGIRISLGRLLPVGLIILGGYLLVNYFKRKDPANFSPEDIRRPTYTLIRGQAARDEFEKARRPSHPGNRR